MYTPIAMIKKELTNSWLIWQRLIGTIGDHLFGEFIASGLNGVSKEGKMVIQYAEVAADATDAQAPFKAGPAAGEVVLPVTAQ
ncbi:MSP domain protein [Aphelenchoides besseyi]|nr:MSP domain protein [Aphelenchoides besseyi]